MLNLEIREAIIKHSRTVIPAIKAATPQHAAILPSEMLAFCCLCIARGCENVVESGRRFGYSTEILSRLFGTISLETSPLAEHDARFIDHPRLSLISVDGERFLPRHSPQAPTGLLLDGPKGLRALALADRIAPHYRVQAIHDAHPGSQLRDAMRQRNGYLTDDSWLVENFGHLDGPSLALRGYQSHEELLSVGNVLAILGDA